jgi:hypothetical protein
MQSSLRLAINFRRVFLTLEHCPVMNIHKPLQSHQAHMSDIRSFSWLLVAQNPLRCAPRRSIIHARHCHRLSLPAGLRLRWRSPCRHAESLTLASQPASGRVPAVNAQARAEQGRQLNKKATHPRARGAVQARQCCLLPSLLVGLCAAELLLDPPKLIIPGGHTSCFAPPQ